MTMMDIQWTTVSHQHSDACRSITKLTFWIHGILVQYIFATFGYRNPEIVCISPSQFDKSNKSGYAPRSSIQWDISIPAVLTFQRGGQTATSCSSNQKLELHISNNTGNLHHMHEHVHICIFNIHTYTSVSIFTHPNIFLTYRHRCIHTFRNIHIQMWLPYSSDLTRKRDTYIQTHTHTYIHSETYRHTHTHIHTFRSIHIQMWVPHFLWFDKKTWSLRRTSRAWNRAGTDSGREE
jgi:hypothetical protein